MNDKPVWKLEAERVGESLPEYWTISELARLLDLYDGTYLSRLAKANRYPSYKIGTTRLVKNEDIQLVIDKIKKR